MHAPLERDTRRGVARRLWYAWQRIGRKIGDVQARALLVIVYFAFVMPFALIVRWTADPLALKPGTPHGWWPRPADRGDLLERARRQF
jgi:hypothetical protein